MGTLLAVGLYLLLSIFVSIILGWMGAYDYTPDYRQVKPTTAKYTMIIIWPFVVLMILMEYLWKFIKFSLGWLDRLFNRVAKVK